MYKIIYRDSILTHKSVPIPTLGIHKIFMCLKINKDPRNVRAGYATGFFLNKGDTHENYIRKLNAGKNLHTCRQKLFYHKSN